MQTLFLHRVPAPPLDAFIHSLWLYESEPRPFALERVLPSGAAQLIVNLDRDETRVYHPERGTGSATISAGSVLSGATTRYAVIDSAEQRCVAGVAFRAGGAAAFFSMPAHEAQDASVPLDLLWGRQRVAELRERLLGTTSGAVKLDILERAVRTAFLAREAHPAVTFALHAFSRREGPVVADVADRTGLSAKRFIEVFKTWVGIAPKQYCRILRFQRALAWVEQGRGVDWTRIALECGYFDQSHFIHDFRSFAGITPTGYEAGRTEFRNHVKFLQSGQGFEGG